MLLHLSFLYTISFLVTLLFILSLKLSKKSFNCLKRSTSSSLLLSVCILFEYNYLIYEIPHFVELESDKEYPDTENPHLDIPNVEEPTQINANIINTKKQIDKDDKTKLSSFFVAEEHNRLTLELIDSGYINENDIQIFYYDDLFENLLKENTYRDLIQIVHYIVPRVINRNFKDEDCNLIKNKFGYFKNSIT